MVGSDRFRLALVVFVVLFAQVLLYPGVPDLLDALGATTSLDAGMWFLTAEFLGFVLFAGLWGSLSDATGKRAPYIALGALGGAVGYGLLATLPVVGVTAFGAVLVLRFIQGAVTIAAFSLAMTMLMDLDGGHGKNMGAAGIAIGLGTALGAPLGGRLTTIDPLAPLYLASGLLAVAAVLTLFVTDRAAQNRDGFTAALSGLKGTPTLLLPYAFGFIDRLTAGFFALVGTFYFRTVFSLDAAQTGLVLALFFVPFALLQYPFGVLSDRIGRVGPVVVGSSLYGVAVIAVGLLPTLNAARVAMVVVGVLGALMAPATMALVNDLARDTERGVAMAGFNIFGSIGFLSGIVVGGAVADTYGFTAAFLVAGGLEIGIALLALPVFVRLKLEKKSMFGVGAER